MDFSTFVRKPFMVEAIEVTAENIHELSPLIGEVREKSNGTPYIQVNQRLVPNIFRVYPGFWVTKVGDSVRCYSKRIFLEQFTEVTPAIEDLVKFINKDSLEESNA